MSNSNHSAGSLEQLLNPALIEAELKRRARNKIARYYPNAGPLRRELYQKHLAFFRGGVRFRERLMLAANRVGKTEGVGAYETALHLTGRYPDWWEGRRWDRPVSWWAAGDTDETVRDILQAKLLGKIIREPGDRPSDPVGLGTGMIQGDAITFVKPKSGTPNAIAIVYVKHASGGTSTLQFKSFKQGRIAFQGTEQDGIWLDEECPEEIYFECLMRTMTTDGMVLLTFTPLQGLTPLILQFLPNGNFDEIANGKLVIFASWDDVPHLSQAAKEELYRKFPPHQRDARAKGIPSLGAGAIYPVPEADIIVDDFPIPEHWPRAYALDVGWNRTAAIWGAEDRESGTIYLYSEYYRGEAEPSVHAQAIKARGAWIRGVIDPAARGRSQADGQQLIQKYNDLGLDLTAANNAVESGIYEVWDRLSSGRLKVFKSLQNYRQEFRLYRRDEKGHIVKNSDHLMDAKRYLVAGGGRDVMRTKPVKKAEENSFTNRFARNTGWMAS